MCQNVKERERRGEEEEERTIAREETWRWNGEEGEKLKQLQPV